MDVKLAVTEQQICPGAQQLVPQQTDVGEQAPALGRGVHGGWPHCPPEQNGLSAGHTPSHEPQWCGSFAGFTQTSLQQVKYELQVIELQDPVEPPVLVEPPEPLEPPEPCDPPEPWAPPDDGEPPVSADPPEPLDPPVAPAPPIAPPPVDEPPLPPLLDVLPPLSEPPPTPASCRDVSLENVVPPQPRKAAQRTVAVAIAIGFCSVMLNAFLE